MQRLDRRGLTSERIGLRCLIAKNVVLNAPDAPPTFADDSFTRLPSIVPPEELGAWQHERDQYDRHIAAQGQQLAALAEQHASLQRYATHLEDEMVRKNQHIAQLETLIEHLGNGRVMRLLALFGKR